MRIRIPAGVRVDGLGIGGRFVSLDMLPVLADATDDTGRALLIEYAAAALDDATAQHERLERKFADDPARYAIQRADAEGRRDFLESFVDETVNTLTGGAEPSEGIGGTRAPDFVTAGASEDVSEDESDEWEIGVDYNGEGSGGRSHDVDINVRIRRADGATFGFHEALAVMGQLRANLSAGAANPIPPGYRMAAINWRRPGRGSVSWGDAGDLDAFHNVLYVVSDDESAWRLGSVE